MKKRVMILMAMLGIVGILGFAATGNAENSTLKIGFTAPLSGGGMSWGYASLAGLELRMDEINAAGGLKVGGKTYTLESIPYDSKYMPDPAVTATKRLIFEDKVKIIFGEVGSAAALAQRGITEPNKVILFTDSYTHKLLGENYPHTFRWFVTNREFVDTMMAYYKKRWPEIKRIAYFYPDDETGQSMFEFEKMVGNKYGIEIVGLPWERGTADLTPIVTKGLASKVDAMDLNGSPPGQAGQLINILRSMGWQKPIVRSGGSVAMDLIRICGERANGVVYHEDGDFTNPNVAKLVQRFENKKYPASPNTMMVPSYDGATLLFNAIQKAGTVDDTEAIIKAMKSIKSFEGIQGTVRWGGKESYGVDHQLYHPVFVGEIIDGKPTVIQKLEY